MCTLSSPRRLCDTRRDYVSFCSLAYTKSYRRIWLKFSTKVRPCTTLEVIKDFAGNTDQHLDPAYFSLSGANSIPTDLESKSSSSPPFRLFPLSFSIHYFFFFHQFLFPSLFLSSPSRYHPPLLLSGVPPCPHL